VIEDAKQQDDAVLKANIEFHTALAKIYKSTQPYFDPLNIQRITALLEKLANQSGNARLLDIGCGTGFIINIAKSIYGQVMGIDATRAMLELVEPAPNVAVTLGDARRMPFGDGQFNVCTAYSVLHHFEHLDVLLNEVLRVLQIGGTFYADEDPNFEYFHLMESLDPERHPLSELVTRERQNVLNKVQQVEGETGLDGDIIKMAEYQKMIRGGMRAEDLRALFRSVGFSQVEITHRWYLGQAQVRAAHGTEAEALIHQYLTSTLPASNHLFKYFQIVAVR
jgi:ubiquinone/menaquinone biosynthesis C-methylase UbiE